MDGGRHVTDVTNASRTLLMNLHTMQWDERIAESIGVPMPMLPEIRSSAEVYGEITGGKLGDLLGGIPVASALGDQQAALFGQTCFAEGETKSTYGTGTFMVMNTGDKLINSYSGLLTTVGYQIGDQKPVYALEGSIAVTGSLVQWMRDQMGLISTAAEIETLALSVEDNGGAYFVPAFSGLFAPYWRSDARGVIAGLTRYVTKAHLARAVLEATAWQTREIADAMTKDSGVELAALKVDGGMTSNNLLMQTLADFVDAPVVRPMVAETTCLGAAYAAGLAVGFWNSTDDLRANWRRAAEWTPAWTRTPATVSTRAGSRPSSGPWAGSRTRSRTAMTTEATLQSVPALGTHPASGSNPSRAETREQLSKASYDLLVIGGGILGISTAWHAAQSGLRVALVDAGDFAGATSSASSKLLHGGLRYLQTGAVKLVAENHFERRAVSRQVAPTWRTRSRSTSPCTRAGRTARRSSGPASSPTRRCRPSVTVSATCCRRRRPRWTCRSCAPTTSRPWPCTATTR